MPSVVKVLEKTSLRRRGEPPRKLVAGYARLKCRWLPRTVSHACNELDTAAWFERHRF